MKKLAYEFVKRQFEKEGYELLTIEYKNNKQKLNYICPNGHKHSISWAEWQQGHRCLYCYGNVRLTIEFIKSEFVKEGYRLLTRKYENVYQKLEYICPKGHKHSIKWNKWQQGKRCLYCYGNVKKDIEFIRSEFAKEGYTLLTEKYKNCSQKLDYVCPKCHKHNISWEKWTQGRRCPYCNNKKSRGEIEVKNFIRSLGIKILPNDRSRIFNPETGNSLELDIFLPTLNKAIEYNGEYWHKNRENIDLLKHQLCESKNIDLLTIWDREWKKNKNSYKDKIKEFILN